MYATACAEQVVERTRVAVYAEVLVVPTRIYNIPWGRPPADNAVSFDTLAYANRLRSTLLPLLAGLHLR
jgi:hypothetical protein